MPTRSATDVRTEVLFIARVWMAEVSLARR